MQQPSQQVRPTKRAFRRLFDAFLILAFFGVALAILVLIGMEVMAQEQAKLSAIQTLSWGDAIAKKDPKPETRPDGDMEVRWKAGDRWVVDVFEKDQKTMGPVRWQALPKRYEYEVSGSDRWTYSLRVREVVGDKKREIAMIAIDPKTFRTRGEEKLPVPWVFPGPSAKGKAYDSIVGLPYDAVIFAQGVVAFPITEIPRSSGKVIDVEFKQSDTNYFQRWDEKIPQFPLCSFTFDRVILLREIGG